MKLVHLTLILFGISLLIGCSGARNPIVPQNSESQPLKAESADSSNHAIIGCGELSLNSETGEAEIIPSRDTEFHLNLAKPMMNTMGISMELVPGASDPAIGLFVLDISLTHPLPGYPEFSGFDMKFILMTPGTLNVDGLMFARMEETQLLNRDGLTRWWNPTEFTNPGFLGYYPGVPGVQNSAPLTATVNPYKLYADSLTAETPVSEVAAPSLDSPEGRAIFKSGEENTRRFEIKFPVNGVPVIIFNYAIDVCWDVPSPNPPTEVPDNFPMTANQPEPFDMRIVIPTNSLEYLDGGGVTGDLRVQAMVADWQGLDSGNIQDEISYVGVSAPTLMNGEMELNFVTENLDYVIYESDVSSSLLPGLTSAGEHMIVVRAESSGADTYTQGGTTVGPAEPISMYQTSTVEIESVTCDLDDNGIFPDAEPIALGGSAMGTLCNPGGSQADAIDIYTFQVPPGPGVYGTVEIHCVDEPTKIDLYGETYNVLGETYVFGGVSSLEYPAHLDPGTYYIGVETENEVKIVDYEIINYYIEDPCDDTIQFDYETTVGPDTTTVIYSGRKSIVTYLTEVWVVYTQSSDPSADTIYYVHSLNGGISWDSPVQVNQLEIACKRTDPTIARSGNGTLYCGWIDYSSGVGEPFVNVSYDGGETWSSEVNLYDFETNPLQPDNGPNGIFLDVDDNNRVHAGWVDSRVPSQNHIYYSYSDDYAVTWTPGMLVDDSSYSIPGGHSSWDMDVNDSGQVAVVWTDRRHITDPPLSSLDIYSDTCDPATGFGTDVMVNPPDLDINQAGPAVGIANDGTLHVVWVDQRNDGSLGGSNPPDTSELYYARSEDGGATFVAETEIPTATGYSSNSAMSPRVEISPWGNPYVFYMYGEYDLFISKSCDIGDTWGPQVYEFTGIPDTYIIGSWCFTIANDGSVYAVHADTRNDPGPGYVAWNLFMEVGM